MLSFAFFRAEKLVCLFVCLFWGSCFRSGTEFDITATRVASSNPLLKEAFVEALAHP